MRNKRRTHTAAFKKRVVLELLKGETTRSEVLSKYEIHGSLADKWVRKAVEELDKIFTERDKGEEEQKLISELYKKLGQLIVETDWLKKKIGLL